MIKCILYRFYTVFKEKKLISGKTMVWKLIVRTIDFKLSYDLQLNTTSFTEKKIMAVHRTVLS